MGKTHIVLGATGHVGSAVVRTLLGRSEEVVAVVRDPKKAEGLGAEVAVADVLDTEALRGVFRRGESLFLLNPPAPPSTDTVAEERRTLGSILRAAEGSGLRWIVAQSTYGAQPGDRVGDLGVLYEMEQALGAGTIPFRIVRAAYYMSNWDSALATARLEGVVPTLFPVDFKLPMVAPRDLGEVAADLLTTEEPGETTIFVEGPERYSASDVASAFEKALGRPVVAVETPRDGWVPALKGLGFSDAAADSMARMTAITLEGQYEVSQEPVRGRVSLDEYVAGLVA